MAGAMLGCREWEEKNANVRSLWFDDGSDSSQFCLGIHLELFPTVAAHFKSNQNLETLMEHVPWMKCQGIAIELTKSIMSCSWTLGHYGPVVCLKWYMI